MPQELHLIYEGIQGDKPICFHLPLSKSIEARRLMLTAIASLPLGKLPEGQAECAEDIYALHKALSQAQAGSPLIDVAESGTAMRLMLAYLSATVSQATILQGQGRQHQRPIAPLTNALRQLGADISYLGIEGFPPLRIKPSKLRAKTITLDASSSSQYLSALMLIAPLVEGGAYSIDTRSYGIASRPYALMTMRQMQAEGYAWQEQDGLFVYGGKEQSDKPQAPHSEADWSAASYAYLLSQMMAKDSKATFPAIFLPKLRHNSLQGDAEMLIHIYERLGIKSHFSSEGLYLSPQRLVLCDNMDIDCEATPDLVPTLVASFIAEGQSFCLKGVHHLRIKESDRLLALQTEFRKIGIHLTLGEDSIAWAGGEQPTASDTAPLRLNPHQDHRIAMALAPLMARVSPRGVIVEYPHCVAKSFPNYWGEISNFGYKFRLV